MAKKGKMCSDTQKSAKKCDMMAKKTSTPKKKNAVKKSY